MLTRPCVLQSVGFKPLQVGLKEMDQTSWHISPGHVMSTRALDAGLLMFENKVVYC